MAKESLKSFMIRTVAFMIAFAIIFLYAQELIRDKWVEGEYDTTVKVRGFYEEEKGDLDVVFFGSSQVYADIAPAVLYRDFGITSYDFACNEQPLYITYYYMKEAFERQDVKLAVLDCFGVFYDSYAEDGKTHINLDDLPMSVNKINAINAAVPRGERYAYYFPLAKYHGTWKEYYPLKYESSFYEKKDVNKGYSPFIFYYEYNDGPPEEVLEAADKEWDIPDLSREWLLKIVDLCRENGVELLLIKTPNGNAERQLHANGAKAFADENGIPFLNLNLIFDGQSHINVLQAENVSQYVGAYLKDNYDITDHRGDASYDAKWNETVAAFEGYRKENAALTKEDAEE